MTTISTSEQVFEVLEARSLQKRSLSTILADHLTRASGTPFFLVANVLFFFLWIVFNSGRVAHVTPFDPFPYGLLTMIVSLEAIVLSIFVLISQNRAAQIATLREELHLRVNEIAEQEITKCLQLLCELREHAGITTIDESLEEMLKPIDENLLEKRIQEQLRSADTALIREFIGNHFSREKQR